MTGLLFILFCASYNSLREWISICCLNVRVFLWFELPPNRWNDNLKNTTSIYNEVTLGMGRGVVDKEGAWFRQWG